MGHLGQKVEWKIGTKKRDRKFSVPPWNHDFRSIASLEMGTTFHGGFADLGVIHIAQKCPYRFQGSMSKTKVTDPCGVFLHTFPFFLPQRGNEMLLYQPGPHSPSGEKERYAHLVAIFRVLDGEFNLFF